MWPLGVGDSTRFCFGEAHQHILYLEMKVKAGEELEKKNEEPAMLSESDLSRMLIFSANSPQAKVFT